MATIDCGFRAAGGGAYSAIGTDGQIDVPNAFVPQTEVSLHITEHGKRREERLPAVDQFALEADEFADALQTGRPLRFPPMDAIANLHVLEALARSAATLGLRQDVRR